MRNALALVGLMVVVFAVVGYFRNWYTFDWQTGSDGKIQVNTKIDTNRIRDDGSKVGQAIGEKAARLGDDLKNKDGDKVPERDFFGVPLTGKSPASLPAPVQR